MQNTLGLIMIDLKIQDTEETLYELGRMPIPKTARMGAALAAYKTNIAAIKPKRIKAHNEVTSFAFMIPVFVGLFFLVVVLGMPRNWKSDEVAPSTVNKLTFDSKLLTQEQYLPSCGGTALRIELNWDTSTYFRPINGIEDNQVYGLPNGIIRAIRPALQENSAPVEFGAVKTGAFFWYPVQLHTSTCQSLILLVRQGNEPEILIFDISDKKFPVLLETPGTPMGHQWVPPVYLEDGQILQIAKTEDIAGCVRVINSFLWQDGRFKLIDSQAYSRSEYCLNN
jgi:hypothetical protein